jgi:hypothetical protein
LEKGKGQRQTEMLIKLTAFSRRTFPSLPFPFLLPVLGVYVCLMRRSDAEDFSFFVLLEALRIQKLNVLPSPMVERTAISPR